MIPASARKQKSQTTSIPAPVGGLNARDSIAQMPPTDAVVADNVFCTPTTVDVRKGSTLWASGITGWVETLMQYSNPTSQKLFAAAQSRIYDVSAQGAVGAPVATGLSNARFQYVNIGTPGGQFLLAVNGQNKLRGYNGTSWWIDGDGTHDITGFDTSKAIHINLHKNRVWMVETASMRVWYLGIQSIAGPASSIDFGTLFHRGGYLMAMASWTIDNTNGIDDYAAFITSEGEVAIYRGYDPNFAASWALVGVFRMGRPIGRRCFAKLGSDVAVICADGLMPLSKSLLTDRSQQQDAISYKITNLINNDVQTYGGNFGWQVILYPIGNKLIVNMPRTEDSTSYQYVMNTITGAWTTYGKYSSPWNAACFETKQDALYYGTDGAVYMADHGYTDDGTPITWDVKPAFSYFGDLGREKQFQMARPIFISDASFQVGSVLNIDFGDLQPQTVTSAVYNGSAWNTSPWNSTPWGGSLQVRKDWLGVNGIGYSAALRLRGSTGGVQISLQSIDYLYQYGGVL